MEMLQLNDLHKTFNPGTVNEKVALNGVSLHMEAGDFATIVGSNGAGKSTSSTPSPAASSPDEAASCWADRISPCAGAPAQQGHRHLFQDPPCKAPHPT